MKQVLMVINAYAPHDPNALYSASSLAKMGYRVRLIGTARQQETDIASRQEVEGVSVQLVPHVVGFSWQALWQLISGRIPPTVHATRARTGLWSFIFFNLWILRLGLGQPMAIVHCHDLSPLPACWLLARLKGAKVLYHARENFPTRYRARRAELVEKMERWLLPRMDAVISSGTRLTDVLRARGAREVVWIGNWKRLEEYDLPREKILAKRAEFGLDADAVLIVYIGTLDPARELMPLLHALEKRTDVHLWIGGQGTLYDEVKAIATTAPNMRWLGWVNLSDVPLYTSCADALYCVLDTQEYGEENYHCPAANKLFESYASGVPLIALKNVNEMADFIAEAHSGILIDDASSDSLNRVFDTLQDRTQLREIQRSAKQEGQKYNWHVAEAKLQQIYERL